MPSGGRDARGLSRRELLARTPFLAAGVLGGARSLPALFGGFSYLTPVDPGTNPLESYPNREWEKVYRDLYSPDSSYHYLCGPNDTHGCLLRANVKNGVVVYADPSYGYGKATDVYGNRASSRWDPRICVSGLSYVRRAYSDRRVQGCYVRKGFKAWVDDGFPRDGETGLPPEEYRSGRGKEEFERITLEEAAELEARAYLDIVETYSGEQGRARLEAQGYDEAMIDAVDGAGTMTVKCRGGMPFDAPFRVGGLYRFANMMALLDAHVRDVPKEEAHGAKHWDSYSWHTDLPPGHPMVTGQQTLDFDLYTAENANLVTLWGMNWIATKMPDGHWLTEAKLHGARVVTIAPEYQSSTSKADRAIVIRPGSDGALALGLAHVIVKEELYDEAFVRSQTDLPLLIRTDDRTLLRAKDVFPGYENAPLSNGVTVVEDGVKLPAPSQQGGQQIPASLREEWGDHVIWDLGTSGPRAVNRDQTGDHFPADARPALEGEFEVTLADGSSVTVRPVFDAIRQYLEDSCSPEQISKVTWAPAAAIEELAREIAANRTKTLFVTGMGPNHFFNNDTKDRTIILVAALTNNVGHFGGTVGSYAGNYRLPIFSGIGQYIVEDPFDITLDPAQPAKLGKFYKGESAHYYNYGDRPLRVGNKLFTGKGHIPTPTKTMHFANSNSLLGNAKGAHNVFVNVLPKIEMIAVNEWFWTASCEYADIVYGVDSWVDRKQPDVFGSVTNPFLSAWPVSPLPRIFDTHDDIEVYAAVAAKLADLTGDSRFADYWHFVGTGQVDAYIQRVFNAGNATKGYSFADLHESCKEGTPFYMMLRTSPKVVGWEQTNESRPWYTKTGRLEFYRDEEEFLEYGENLPVHREPVDGTVFEPNVIMAEAHPLLAPAGPEEYGLDPDDLSVEVRQVRNVVRTPDEIAASKHPLTGEGFTHILITPKYRHACHSMGASTDTDTIIWGPFGDFYRHDKRKPWMSEGYVDLNPEDAAELGVEDGDYMWCDADPSDRPFVGWQDKPDDYKVCRWLVRARVNPSVARRVGRAWFHFYVSTHGSVEGHETREDGLAKNPRTNYQAGYRYGSHQSVTRAWLRPTLMTESLVRKDAAGQLLGKGFELDVHCADGAPKESFVKMERAEPGGESGEGQWYPAAQGFRPGSENEAMKKYLRGEYGSGR
ncbi:MAG: molybdopterin-dependent oxidoreductase [Acidimicrobiia bacterium]|nr:molybdopterin-dependent oxidoreductase [Acidimicrobiia bacterium]